MRPRGIAVDWITSDGGGPEASQLSVLQVATVGFKPKGRSSAPPPVPKFSATRPSIVGAKLAEASKTPAEETTTVASCRPSGSVTMPGSRMVAKLLPRRNCALSIRFRPSTSKVRSSGTASPPESNSCSAPRGKMRVSSGSGATTVKNLVASDVPPPGVGVCRRTA